MLHPPRGPFRCPPLRSARSALSAALRRGGAAITDEAMAEADAAAKAAAGGGDVDGDALFWNSFYAMTAMCVLLQVYVRRSSKSERTVSEAEAPPGFAAFQKSFLAATLLAMFADWLQGPYVYALYDEYGFSHGDIALLFVAGFLSSAICGTAAGGAADILGRKRACQAFSLIYVLSAVTKLFNNFGVLLVGRITGGLSTSLLFSSFESWMVCEHRKRGYPTHLLPQTFAYLQLGNGIAAVLAGIVAQAAASQYGPVAPFMVCIVPLCLQLFVCTVSWTENYGDAAEASTTASLLAETFRSTKRGYDEIRADRALLFLGCGQCSFEAAMYTFVFMWTPSLQSNPAYAEAVGRSLGLIFAVFMVCAMTGSALFSKLADKRVLGVQRIPNLVHELGAVSCLSPMLMPSETVPMYLSFLLLELLVGVFYPVYGTMRGLHVPERVRTSVMNIFRIPLNLFVVVVLSNIESLSISSVFLLCLISHTCGFLAYRGFRATVDAGEADAKAEPEDAPLLAPPADDV